MIEEFHAELLPGKIYHIYNRAHGDERMFREPRNYVYFLQQYQQRLSPFVRTSAFCLLPNHFHLLVQVKDIEDLEFHANRQILDVHTFLASSFRNFFVSYTKSFNQVYRRKGGLFMNRFKRKEISNDLHLITVLVYIHNNPLSHGLTDDLNTYRYSSFHDYKKGHKSWLYRDLIESRFDTDILWQLHRT